MSGQASFGFGSRRGVLSRVVLVLGFGRAVLPEAGGKAMRGSRRGVPAATTMGGLVACLAATLIVAGCAAPATTHHNPGTDHGVAGGASPEAGGLREASGGQSITLEVRRDTVSGWNVHVAAEGFRFTPDSVGGAAIPGSGHVRLYLDGERIARLYGPWYHLDARAVPAGTHELKAELVADDHTAWSRDGRPITATTTLGAATPGAAGPKEIRLGVAGGRTVSPLARVEVAKGARIRLIVTSDVPDEVHVHGYDLARPLTPGKAVTLDFTASESGLFEVETHESGLVLTQLAVR
ncbi:cupredoxin domain-containing protein [Streptosporangium soli]|nr:hypothetical protein [Streptosporangium sp. KLBMP 9127]